MVGLYISNLKKNATLVLPDFGGSYVQKENTYKNWNMQALFLEKFMGDKVFVETDDYVIITDGVVVNSKQLCQECNTDCLQEYIVSRLNAGDYTFWKLFRGSFSGAFFIKQTGQWYCYVSQIGDRPLFYYKTEDELIIASSVRDIINTLDLNQCKLSLNEEGVYNLLTYGFMQDSETLFTGVKRIRAGEYCIADDNRIEVKRYHMLSNHNVLDATEDEIIEAIDEKFRAAVKLEYDKDLEYGYKHLSSLSGGLDARMSVWMATELGYKDIHTCTFCQSGYLDEKIAQQIATHLNTNHMFKSLDDGVFIKKMDEIAMASYGIVDSSQIMHALHMMENLDLSKTGMLHTGQLGDVVIGAFTDADVQESPVPFFKAYSAFVKDKNKDESYKKYDNLELYAMYTRGFQGALGSQIVHNQYMEMYSAFYDLDFFEFCMSIPLKYRRNEEIYKKWIIKKYPEAAAIEWERIHGKITEPQLWVRIRRKLNRMCTSRLQAAKYQMNPYDLWCNEIQDIRAYVEKYFEENIQNSHLSESLREDLINMFKHVSAREKLQVLTVLSVVKNYF